MRPLCGPVFVASSTHGSYQPALSLVLSTSGQATVERESSYRLPLTAFHQMPVASHRALSPELHQALLHTRQRAAGLFSRPASPRRKPVPLRRNLWRDRSLLCWRDSCSSRGTGRGAGPFIFLASLSGCWGEWAGVEAMGADLALRCLGRASALRVRAGEGQKLAPALPVRCPPQRGRWGQEASAPGWTAGSRAAHSQTGAVWVTERVRTPNVLTEIQVFMSECFSVCCIFLKVIFTSCGGSTRAKGATALARHPTTADSRGAGPSCSAEGSHGSVFRMLLCDTCPRFDDS